MKILIWFTISVNCFCSNIFIFTKTTTFKVMMIWHLSWSVPNTPGQDNLCCTAVLHYDAVCHTVYLYQTITASVILIDIALDHIGIQLYVLLIVQPYFKSVPASLEPLSLNTWCCLEGILSVYSYLQWW